MNTDNSKKRNLAFYITIVAVVAFFAALLVIYLLFKDELFPSPVTGSTSTGTEGTSATETVDTLPVSSATAEITKTEEPLPTTEDAPPTTEDAPVTETPPVTEIPPETQTPPETEIPPETQAPVTEEPVSIYTTVDDTYFEDAVFIGDSMVETFIRYANLKTSAFYYRGIMINNVTTKKFIKIVEEEELVDLPTALEKTPGFKKVYLVFGTNEHGWSYPKLFKGFYKKLIDMIIEHYPDAVIYVHSTFPVTTSAEKRTDAVYDNAISAEYRRQEMELCEEYKDKNVYYLDVASIYTGEDGYMMSEVSLDGVHPTREYTKLWLEYLKTHAIIPSVKEDAPTEPSEDTTDTTDGPDETGTSDEVEGTLEPAEGTAPEDIMSDQEKITH